MIHTIIHYQTFYFFEMFNLNTVHKLPCAMETNIVKIKQQQPFTTFVWD